MAESMNEQPDGVRRGYDQYALERDRAELERLLIQHEATERMRTELDMARIDAAKGESYRLCAGCGWPDTECQCPDHDSVDQTERIMSDLRHEDLMRDDEMWDQAWEQFVDELYAGEQLERDAREHDEGIQDK